MPHITAALAAWELPAPGQGRCRLQLTAVPSLWLVFSQLEVPAVGHQKGHLI